jgi:hypothetical protein
LNSTIQLDVAKMICVVNCTKKKQQENHIWKFSSIKIVFLQILQLD